MVWPDYADFSISILKSVLMSALHMVGGACILNQSISMKSAHNITAAAAIPEQKRKKSTKLSERNVKQG